MPRLRRGRRRARFGSWSIGEVRHLLDERARADGDRAERRRSEARRSDFDSRIRRGQTGDRHREAGRGRGGQSGSRHRQAGDGKTRAQSNRRQIQSEAAIPGPRGRRRGRRPRRNPQEKRGRGPADRPRGRGRTSGRRVRRPRLVPRWPIDNGGLIDLDGSRRRCWKAQWLEAICVWRRIRHGHPQRRCECRRRESDLRRRSPRRPQIYAARQRLDDPSRGDPLRIERQSPRPVHPRAG